MGSGWTGKAILAAAALLAAAQLVPVSRENSPVRAEIDAPRDVERLLRRACWNCHSSETDWPWYSHVAPVSWYVTDHVRDGREDLNFTDWPSDPGEAADLVDEVGAQVESGAMPPSSYRLTHPEARLTDRERQRLVDWSVTAGSWNRLDERLP